MENQFYHIKRPPLSVTINIMHVPNLGNWCYANVCTACVLKDGQRDDPGVHVFDRSV